MAWTVRQADVHTCDRPIHRRGDGVRTGDVWQCDDCQTQWLVRVESDQREPGNWFTWRRAQ